MYCTMTFIRDGDSVVVVTNGSESLRIWLKNIVEIARWSDGSSFPHYRGHVIIEQLEERIRMTWFDPHNAILKNLSDLRSAWCYSRQSKTYPGGNCWDMDLGDGPRLLMNESAVAPLVRKYEVEHVAAPGVFPSHPHSWVSGKSPIPEELLRDPVGVTHSDFEHEIKYPKMIGDVDCSARIRRRIDETTAYLAGQRRTTKGRERYGLLFRTDDGGKSWSEIPLKLDFWQRFTPAGWLEWPPTSIMGIRIEAGQLTIYFWDDVPEYVPEWKAVLDPVSGRWRMSRQPTFRWAE